MTGVSYTAGASASNTVYLHPDDNFAAEPLFLPLPSSLTSNSSDPDDTLKQHALGAMPTHVALNTGTANGTTRSWNGITSLDDLEKNGTDPTPTLKIRYDADGARRGVCVEGHVHHEVTMAGDTRTLRITKSTALLSIVFYLSLSGSAGSMRGATRNRARLDAMAENAKALVPMNLELQEASVRDQTVQIFRIDDDGVMAGTPVDPKLVPPPGTVSPTTDSIADESYASRFMTVGGFNAVGDNMEVESAGPYHDRLGTGVDTDFRRDRLVRIDETGAEAPRVSCRGVSQVIFRRDARGGALLITLITSGRDPISGTQIPIRQVLTVTPKNDFSENLAHFDLHGEEL